MTMPASKSRLTNAAAVRVFPVPVAISTSRLRLPRETSAHKCVYALDLIVPVHDPAVRFDGGQVATNPPRGDPTLQVILRIEARDLPRMGVGFAVEKPHLLAVRKEGERNVELGGVVATLILCRDWIDPGVLRLQRRHGTAGTVAKHVVGTRAVRQRVFEENVRPVGHVPPGVLQQRVDLNAGKRFGSAAHVPAHGSTRSSSMSKQVASISRRDRQAAGACDHRDLAIGGRNSSAPRAAHGGDITVLARRIAVEG